MWSQLRKYWMTVLKYRVLIGAVTVVCLLVTFFSTLRMPKLYRANAVIELESRSESIVPTIESQRSSVPYWNLDEFIYTQTKIIESREVARRAIETLGLKDWTPEMVIQAINVRLIEKSRLVEIEAIVADPDLAVSLAMAVSQAYMDNQFEKQVKQSRLVVQWLSDRIDEVHEDLRKSQEDQLRFAADKRIVSLEDRRNVLTERLENTEGAYGKARTERLELEANYRKLQAIHDDKDAGISKLTGMLVNNYTELGTNIRSESAQVEAAIAERSVIYGPEHPELKSLIARRDELNRQVRGQVEQLVERARIEWQVAQAKETQLSQELRRLTDEILAFNDTWLSYTTLAQSVDKNEKIYDILMQRLKEADVTRNLQNETAQLVEAATPNYRHFSPNMALNLGVALLLGLALGIGLAFVAEYYDPRIKFASEFSKLTKLPVLVEMPVTGEHILAQEDREDYVRKIVFHEPASPEAELYRVLRTQITFGGENRKPLRTVMVTGVHPKEGKSTVASNLGISIASMDRKVLMVDGDIRRASLSSAFHFRDVPGIADVLAGTYDWQSVIQTTDVPNLFLVPAGRIVDNPSELLLSGHLKRLLHNWQTEFDHVIIDMAPVLAVSDALTLAASVDGCLLVLKPETSTKEDILETVERLRGVQANILGAVFNQVRQAEVGANPYYYYYRSGNLETEL